MSNEVTLTGRVVTGVGQASGFTQIPWVKALFIDRLGVDPYPGTLNLKLEDAGQLASWHWIIRQDGITLPPPNGDFCAAKGFKVTVAGSYPGAIILPLVQGYPDDTIEIIAPVHLKQSLAIEDGSIVSVKVTM